MARHREHRGSVRSLLPATRAPASAMPKQRDGPGSVQVGARVALHLDQGGLDAGIREPVEEGEHHQRGAEQADVARRQQSG